MTRKRKSSVCLGRSKFNIMSSSKEPDSYQMDGKTTAMAHPKMLHVALNIVHH